MKPEEMLEEMATAFDDGSWEWSEAHLRDRLQAALKRLVEITNEKTPASWPQEKRIMGLGMVVLDIVEASHE